MTKKVVPTWAEPHDQKRQNHLQFTIGQDFAVRLRTALEQMGWTPSDLARRIWGDAPPTPAGHVSAKNRDRISKYLTGKTIPDAHTLRLLAEHLKVSEESLAPQVVSRRLDKEHPEVRLTAIAGHRDQVHMTLNTRMSLARAAQILALVSQPEDSTAPAYELREPLESATEETVRVLKRAFVTDDRTPAPPSRKTARSREPVRA